MESHYRARTHFSQEYISQLNLIIRNSFLLVRLFINDYKMVISIDNIHTRTYYDCMDRLYQLRAFYTYAKPEIDKFIKLYEEFRNIPNIGNKDITSILRDIDLHRVSEFRPFFNNLLYIFIIMTMENYFNNILRLIFNNKIVCLKNNQKSYTREEILNYKDFNSLIEKIIEDEIFVFDIKNDYYKKIKYFESKFKINLSRINNIQNEMIEICEIRNIIVHNDSKVNEKFLEKVKKINYSIGDEIVIDDYKIFNSIEKIQFVLTILDEQIMDKFFYKKEEIL